MSRDHTATAHLVSEQPLDPPVPDRFSVHNEKTANWLVRRILEARAYGQRAKQWAEDEQRRARREEEFFLHRFGPQLRRWLERELAARGGRAKSVPLPAGRVGTRHIGPKIEVIDPDAVLTWAKTNCPDGIKRSETVLKTALNDHLELTGELPDGTTLEPARDDLFVR